MGGFLKSAEEMKHYFKRIIVLLFLLLVVFSEVALVTGKVDTFFLKSSRDLSSGSLKVTAQKVIESCKNESFRPKCYDEEIPKLLGSMSMENAFEVARIVQEDDEEYRYCHVLGHNLSYAEASRDLDSWKEVITRCPQNFCNNGCVHGALMRRFNSESLTSKEVEVIKPELLDICEPREGWNPLMAVKSMCYHGLGHMVMFITGANIPKSLELCDYIGNHSGGEHLISQCLRAVFMQLFQPLEPEDFALVEGLTPTKQNLEEFCSQFRDRSEAYHTCRREAWILYRDEIESGPTGLKKFCSYTEEKAEQRICYSYGLSVMTVLLAIHQNSLEALEEYCLGLGEEWSAGCFSDAALRLIRIDPRYKEKSVKICEISGSDGCFADMVREADFLFLKGSDGYIDYCNVLPEKWRETCLES